MPFLCLKDETVGDLAYTVLNGSAVTFFYRCEKFDVITFKLAATIIKQRVSTGSKCPSEKTYY